MAYNIVSKHASLIGLEPTKLAQVNYCFSHNMIMVTMSREIAKTCKNLNHPVIYVKGDYSVENIAKLILTYADEVKYTFLIGFN